MPHTQDKSSAFAQGLLIFVYLAALTALEYFIAVTFKGVPILALVAVVKAALVMYYYMHIYKLNEDGGSDHHSYAYKTVTNRIGLWLFLLSDAFVFGGLMTARIQLEHETLRGITWLQWLQFFVRAGSIILFWPLVLFIEKFEHWVKTPGAGDARDDTRH